MENPTESLIDKSYIIRKIRVLLPKEYRIKDDEDTSLEKMNSMNLAKETQVEEPIEENEEIESGKLLWDLSSLKEHAIFLEQNHIIPILTNIIALPSKHTSRLLEIAIGILANLMLIDELSTKLTSRKELINAIEQILITCDDSLILCEVIRLINAGICSKTEAKIEWIALSNKNSSIILSTLMNTLNETLVERLSSLIVNLLSIESNDSEKWREKGIIEIIGDLMVQSEHGTARTDVVLTEILRILEFYSSDDKFLEIVGKGDPNGDIRLSNILGRLSFFIKNRDSQAVQITSCVILGNFATCNRSIILDLFRADKELLKAFISLFPTEEESLENALWILSSILIGEGREECLRMFAENATLLLEQAENTHQESNQVINYTLISLLKGLNSLQKQDNAILQALKHLNSVIE